MNLFYSDTSIELEVSYKELLTHVSKPSQMHNKHLKSDYYSFFVALLRALYVQKPFNVSDENLYDKVKKSFQKDSIKLSIDSFEDLKKGIRNGSPQSNIIFSTSGTTGQPKIVQHNLDSLLERIHISKKHQNDIWGFAYNPTHMAGIQVFLQAFLNENPIIRLFELDRSSIFDSINTYKISHISATPTFYRLLLSKNKKFPSVVRLTMGGEGHGKSLEKKLKDQFPNAELRNIYASTEAGALFETSGEIFTVKDFLYGKVVIQEEELVLHESLLAEGIRSKIDDDWYRTGDLVEVIEKNPLSFKFKGRKNEMINVGGYKVNPNSVEEVINKMDGIANSRVYSKENKLIGKIVCCEIVSTDDNINEKVIRNYLKKELNDYEIPRLVEFVDRIKTTNTGKLKRDG